MTEGPPSPAASPGLTMNSQSAMGVLSLRSSSGPSWNLRGSPSLPPSSARLPYVLPLVLPRLFPERVSAPGGGHSRGARGEAVVTEVVRPFDAV
ncbi:hypothetical protein GCM10010420_07180 [Streptomyces glaucosporus]|uniref:Uncharacterized protein n=1 Tax=Streptomyces glaucosporus TaxID=284044 RepID=A0ABP5UWE2_9ACTN